MLTSITAVNICDQSLPSYFAIFTGLDETTIDSIMDHTMQRINDNKLLSRSSLHSRIQKYFTEEASRAAIKETIRQVYNIAQPGRTGITENLHAVTIESLPRVAANHIMLQLVPCVIKAMCSTTPTLIEGKQLSDNDRRAIYYVAGYIIRSVAEKYSRLKKSDLVEELYKVVSDECEDASYADWTVMQSRGGLLYVSNSCFELFCAMEGAVQPTLSSGSIRNCHLMSYLEDIITDDNCVNKQWHDVFGQNLASLFRDVVKKFCNVRCRAYVDRVQKLYMKSLPHKTGKTSASLRKDLQLKATEKM